MRNWDKNGILKPYHITKSGYWYYLQEQLGHFFGLRNNKMPVQKKLLDIAK